MREREIFLDRLRVAATCAVILLHTVTGVMDAADMTLYPFENKVFLIVLDLVCWCVPVFLLISGYLFLKPEREIGMKKMLTRYCRRIVLALFLFGVPYACMEQILVEKSFQWSMIGNAFLMVLRGRSWSHMWYLYMILLLYLLTPAFKWLLARIPRAAVYVLLAVLFIACSVLPYVAKLLELEAFAGLPEKGIHFFYYICGYLFATGNEKPAGTGPGRLKDTGRRIPWISCLAALLAAGMVISRLSGTYTIQMAYNYPFTAALALLLFGWGCSARNQSPAERIGSDSFLEQCAALSFAVYLVHPVFLNLAYKVLHITPLSFAVAVSLPVFLSGTLLLSVIVAWILRKIPLLRKYVL